MKISKQKRKKIINTLKNSSDFKNGLSKSLIIKELEMFMDMYDWNDFYDRDITIDDYEKYFESITKKYVPHMNKYFRKSIKKKMEKKK
ncbi:hypothetical protein CPG37_10830 [Malaciobacter canalis]|uniref:Uncharacterized protein n=1 Tax=Malaciobacter canalis TaxID=1912871 RepID=A0ABX4LMI4_9BACT|nr:hypothetical protein [Malaciobacter canalis]PHO09084.1 hypothetical protein CPG37_10830 [Malaciobacter canalis]QEE31812.1 hypothetical protein ACAN_0301 [Malaciobacter canalis]